MVKRWQRHCKMKISVPWPSGEQVHRIDLAIKDYSVLWEEKSLKLAVELEREIQALGTGGEVLFKKDLVRLEKEFPVPPELIRRQPLQISVTPDYLVNVVRGENSLLEQGFYLHLSAWERKKKQPAAFDHEEQLMISGRVVVEEGVHVELIDLPLPTAEAARGKLEARISDEKFLLLPHGINFQGKLLLDRGDGEERSYPLSILIPQKVTPGRQVEGQASVYMVKRGAGGKVLFGVQIAWRMTKEEELTVVIAPPGDAGRYSLCTLEAQTQKVLRKELTLKLPEPVRLLEQVQTGELRSAVMVGPKGLLFAGLLDLDLFYISRDGQEKCYQTKFPFEEWIGEASREREYRLKVNGLRLDHPPLPAPAPGKDLLLNLELDYCLTTLRRREAGLPPPASPAPTRKILVEKIITREPLEYYVEIPLSRPPDFRTGHQVRWAEGVVEGRAGRGAVFLKVEPLLTWEYKNELNQVKMVEVKPVIQWVYPSLLAQPGVLARAEVDGTQMKLKMNSQGELLLQLLLIGKLTLSQEELKAVRLPEEAVEKEAFATASSVSCKWEEKLLFFPQTISAVHFFYRIFAWSKWEEPIFWRAKPAASLLTWTGRGAAVFTVSARRSG